MIDWKRQDLHSGWMFAFAEHGKVQGPDDCDRLTFLEAQVPGTNLTDLQRHGMMPASTAADYEARFRPFARQDFIYRLRFQPERMAEARHCLLCFEGLDTVCDIFLNGTRLAQTENAFRSYSLDVKEALRPGDNELLLIFRSPLVEAKKRQQAFGHKFPAHLDLDFMFLRKPAYSFFWDWGPELPVSGIFRPVYLKAFDFAEIADVNVRYRLQNGDAHGTVVIETRGMDGGMARLHLDGKKYEAAIQNNRAEIAFNLPKVHLWWPNGMGEPYLYDCQLELCDAKKRVVQRQKRRLGFRELTLEQTPRNDGQGKRFLFRINGVPVLVRGYNWIPADNSLPAVDENRYQQLLQLARDSHCNMVRVWGGGFYESDLFYEWCDTLGLLVWQDAMFACAMYPDTDAGFVKEVAAELDEHIRRLRNHPSLAIWCGGNETLWGWERGAWGDYRQGKSPYYGKKIYDELLPDWLRALDPDRIYIPNSPFSPDPTLPANDYTHGCCHYWELHWQCGDYTEYDADAPSFVTETGIQSFPDPYTAMNIGEPSDRHFQSWLFDSRNHYESPAKNERLLKFIAALYRIRDDFEYMVYLSNLAHGDYLRYAVEHWRCHAFDFGGVMVWQLNDCWPAISWSTVDYFLKPKAAYYALKQAFAPIVPVFKQPSHIQFDPEVEKQGVIRIVCDSEDMIRGRIKARVLSLDGEIRYETEMPCHGKGPVLSAGGLEIPGFAAIRMESVLQLIFDGEDGRQVERIYPLARPKHMRITRPRLKLMRVDDTTVQVQSDRYARGVYLHYPVAGVYFDDNFFDVLPGQTKTLRANAPLQHDRLRIWSYYHS